MRIVKLDPSLLTSQDRSFILKFSLLEHDLLHFFENKDYEHAHEHIDQFFRDCTLQDLSSEVVLQSLIGLVGGLTNISFFTHLNIAHFLELRLAFIKFLSSQNLKIEDFRDILFDIVQTFFSYNDEPTRNVDFPKVSKQVALTAYYINMHRYERLRIDQIFATLNLDKKYTLTRFRAELGFSVTQYIRHVKMTEAKNLLLNTSMSIGKIAQILKFYDTANFSREFFKEYAVSPHKYRQLNRLV